MFLIFVLWGSSIHLLLGTRVNAVITNVRNKDQIPINLQSLSPEEKKNFKDSFDAIFSDCDGVLYNPKGIINNAHQAITELSKQGKTVHYITNNSTETRAQIAKKFENLGFADVTADSIISPAGLAADYLRGKLPSGKAVYVVGPSAVCEELSKRDIPCFGPGRDDMSEDTVQSIIKSVFVFNAKEHDVGAVIVGKDVYINYLKILKAFSYLQNKECLFIATNLDETYSTGSGTQFPDAGAMVAAISKISGREPFILGKPGEYLVDVLRSMHDPKRTLFVGDRLNTDISMGNKCFFRTVLVLTGVHGLSDVERYAESKDVEERLCVPDYYTNAFSDLTF